MPIVSNSPAAAFFDDGQVFTGSLVLLMQLSIVLAPLAVRLGRQLDERHNVERILFELSEQHRPPIDPYAMPTKRFRTAV
jgi:hypothetical protein